MIKSFHRRHGGNFPRENVPYNKSKASRATGAIESPSRTANRESRTRSNYWLSQRENQDGVCLSVTCPAEILCRTSRRQMIGRQCRREKTRDESHRGYGWCRGKQGWACNYNFFDFVMCWPTQTQTQPMSQFSFSYNIHGLSPHRIQFANIWN